MYSLGCYSWRGYDRFRRYRRHIENIQRKSKEKTLGELKSIPSPSQGYKRINPYFIPRILINMTAGFVSLQLKLKARSMIEASYPCL